MKRILTSGILILLTAACFAQIPAGVILWLKADAGVQADALLRVSKWNDQSGNNNHATQASINSQPLLLPGLLNGRPVIRFDGVNDIMLTTAINLSTTPRAEIYIIYRSAGNNEIIFEQTNNINSNAKGLYLIDHYVNSSSGLSAALKGNAAGGCGFPNGSNNQTALFTNNNTYCFKLVTAVYDKSLSSLSQVRLRNNKVDLTSNGTSYYCSHTDNFANDVFYIGGRGNGATNLLHGDIAEVIIYPAVQSTSNRQQVEDYLMTKYFSGSGAQQFTKLPTNKTASASFMFDGVWNHSFNGADSTQVIASVSGDCTGTPGRSDTVYVESQPVQYGGTAYLRRHYVIKEPMINSALRKLRLYYTDEDFKDLQTVMPCLLSPNQLMLKKYSGPGEDGVLDTVNIGRVTRFSATDIVHGSFNGYNYLEFTTDTLGEFWIHAGTVPPAFNFLNFSVQADCTDLLEFLWQTENENCVSKYEIQQSSNQVNFSSILTLPARNKPLNNYDTILQPPSGVPGSNARIFYRIKKINDNGQVTYSNTAEIFFADARVLKVYPVPVRQYLYIAGSKKCDKLIIYNMLGQRVKLLSIAADNKYFVGDLANGVYIIKLIGLKRSLTKKILINHE